MHNARNCPSDGIFYSEFHEIEALHAENVELRARLERAEEALERLITFVENPTYDAGAAVAEAYAALDAAGERGKDG